MADFILDFSYAFFPAVAPVLRSLVAVVVYRIYLAGLLRRSSLPGQLPVLRLLSTVQFSSPSVQRRQGWQNVAGL